MNPAYIKNTGENKSIMGTERMSNTEVDKAAVERVIEHAKRNRAVTGQMGYSEAKRGEPSISVVDDEISLCTLIDGKMYYKAVKDWQNMTTTEILFAFRQQDWQRFKLGEKVGM